MSEDQDREFDKYLAGGSRLSDAYAELPEAEPPAYLDYAIRDEAHRVVGAGAVPGRARGRARATSSGWRGWQKWTMPLSVAATLIIVTMVGLQLPYIVGQQPEPAAPAPMLQQAEPGSVILKKKQAAPLAPEPPAKPETGGGAVMQDRLRGNAGLREVKPQVSGGKRVESLQVEQPAPAKTAPAATLGAAPAAPPAAMEEAPAPAAAQSVAPAPAVQQAPASRAARRAPQQDAPVPWLARIRQLKQEGKQAEAKRALAAFSKRYPKYPIPDDLRDLR